MDQPAVLTLYNRARSAAYKNVAFLFCHLCQLMWWPCGICWGLGAGEVKLMVARSALIFPSAYYEKIIGNCP
jgi:hypothetical protein